MTFESMLERSEFLSRLVIWDECFERGTGECNDPKVGTAWDIHGK